MSEPEPTLSFLHRLWFAWICFFRVILDGAYAQRAWNARAPAALPPAPEPARLAPAAPPAAPKEPEGAAALQLLALFQREGRFVDFLEQDITSFGDAEVGSVARVVHQGCRKALHEHVELTPVRSEDEGVTVTLAEGYSPAEVKLSGDVQGSAPYKGALRHRGWRATSITLPTPVKGHDPHVLAPAEVEL